MLGGMQQPADIMPSPTGPSFASLLAALTTPAEAEQCPAWDESKFEDDVATLSYESALKANARYRPSNSSQWNLPERFESTAALVAEENAARAKAAEAASVSATNKTDAALLVAPALDETRKRASVTIRMSEAECAQLQKRAVEAGLTVSAYLRSCTFEAEALRAQVKEALAELRMGKPSEKAVVKDAVRGSWRKWLLRILPHWQVGRRAART